MNLRWYPVLILFILYTACRKKTLSVSLLPVIEIGNMNGMKVNTLNNTFEFAFQSPSMIGIDVNNDGENDLAYWISRSGSPGSGYGMVHHFELLSNKISLKDSAYNDSSFKHTDTSYTMSGGHVWKYMSVKYFFTRQSNSDTVFQNHYPFKTMAMKAFDKLQQSDSYANFNTAWGKSINLINWNEDDKVGESHSADTSYVYINNMNVNRYPYPLNKEIYFGFRFYDDEIIRLGWVKFIIVNDYTVKIIETAIQK